MRCSICKHGNTVAGTTTVTFERNGATLIIKDVPAQVCPNCGEAYVDEETTAQLLESAEKAAKEGIQVEVRAYHIA